MMTATATGADATAFAAGGPILSIRGVSQRFGGVRALNDVSFDVGTGTVTSVIGPNGAGKTTLFNIVSGLQKPTAGRVVFAGTDVTGQAPHRIVGHGLARTFQNLQLFDSLNAIENVMAARYCRSKSGIIDTIFQTPRDRGDRRQMREVAEK